ncbi:MAG: bifunctional folylpolyglutamate synthase/dihydrofolate synthase [Clostridia bacterium]|nr:bifunctional folylpolyglutamate synthase/dihydrofolate synthase [Clostridia bacterium]
MTEAEAIEKIHSVYPSGKKEGLTNMRKVMARLGDVQNALAMVHVAGTNGKGSTCAMIERAMREAGYKTGMYTSPYIETYNERIRMDGKPIEGDKLAQLVEEVWPIIEGCREEGLCITEFELGTVLAFLAFAKEKVDISIIEVGLGGRLDPTNIICPLVSVITNVGMDHMHFLGDTIEEIAMEKAGIMKPDTPVVLGWQEENVRAALEQAAKALDISVTEPQAENVREEARSVAFDAQMGGETIKGITVSLIGRHQAQNACAALGALDVLKSRGYDRITEETIRRAFADVHWPGRLEFFGNVILDGAHNEPGVKALCAYMDAWLPKGKTVLLSGMMADKDTAVMTQMLAPRAMCVVATQPAIPRAMAAQELAKAFERQGMTAYAVAEPKAALEKAREIAGEGGTVLCAGSLYLIGEIRSLLRQEGEFEDVV